MSEVAAKDTTTESPKRKGRPRRQSELDWLDRAEALVGDEQVHNRWDDVETDVNALVLAERQRQQKIREKLRKAAKSKARAVMEGRTVVRAFTLESLKDENTLTIIAPPLPIPRSPSAAVAATEVEGQHQRQHAWSKEETDKLEGEGEQDAGKSQQEPRQEAAQQGPQGDRVGNGQQEMGEEAAQNRELEENIVVQHGELDTGALHNSASGGKLAATDGLANESPGVEGAEAGVGTEHSRSEDDNCQDFWPIDIKRSECGRYLFSYIVPPPSLNTTADGSEWTMNELCTTPPSTARPYRVTKVVPMDEEETMSQAEIFCKDWRACCQTSIFFFLLATMCGLLLLIIVR